ncbi:MAG: hypothetical protein KatS3mg050_2696 [Litorilinea sp.]|nr:MAG: hypothetical protein KatS3mg050_2696 [Litorilinea sp.]
MATSPRLRTFRLWLALIGILAGFSLAPPVQADSHQPAEPPARVPLAAQASTQGPIDNLEDARQAVIQIEAVGTFMDPAEGLVANAAGRGSGFIIDETGIAVTNNHVVTGGALFKVYVDGYDRPLNARVLGVSECADLAVIDIQGEGFPYLQWYEGPIRVGLDVYAAGFPLGDPEYTLTRGIISKARASGETSWASVDQVLQHDASLNPGNSGGPLLDAQGRVVGVNYRRNEADQFFAISRDEALPLIALLREGHDVDSIGINGEAVTDGQDLFGIWVASVKSGSPADRVGLQPGDVILTMEGVSLATDGTMSTYCDILRSHSPEDVLSLEVLRLSTQEILQGQLNGRPLEPKLSFASQFEQQGQTQAEAGTPGTAQEPAPPAYDEYMTITDEQGIFSVEVPTTWVDVTDTPWQAGDEIIGISLFASPDLKAFADDWGVPGLLLRYSEVLAQEMTTDDLLDVLDLSSDCTYKERSPLSVGNLSGAFDVWVSCAEAQTAALVAALAPPGGEFLVRVEIYVASDADLDVVDRVFNTLVVTPPGAQVETAAATEPASGDEPPDTTGLQYDYVAVEDETISALLPAAWSDHFSDEWLIDGESIGRQFSASTDLAAFNDSWSIPGVFIYTVLELADDFDPVDGLDASDFSDICQYDDRAQHSHTIFGVSYQGAYDIWHNCGDEENIYLVLSAVSEPRDHAVLIYFLGTSEADVEAFDVLARSFFVSTPVTAPIIQESQQASQPIAYTTVADAEGLVAVDVPESWADVGNEDWILENEVVGRMLTAAPDLDAFINGWDTPGVLIGASQLLASLMTPAEVLDLFDFSDECTADDRYEYADAVISGVYDVWLDCGGSGGTFVVLAVNPVADGDLLLLLLINLPDETDLPAFERILQSLSPGNVGRGPEPPVATVIVNALNVRNGPGTNYSRVGAVRDGTELQVAGQVNECAWLFVTTPDGLDGWVSGNPQYVSLSVPCAQIPAVEPPPPPRQSSPAAPAAGSAQQPAPANSQQGCYLFQNHLGAELTITFTGQGGSWNQTFKLGPQAEVEKCFPPGRYTYTLDAPPPWGSTNGELEVRAGDYYLFPVRGE